MTAVSVENSAVATPSPDRSFYRSPRLRLMAVKAVVCVGFIFGLALSPRLWQGERSLPTAPILDALRLPSPLDKGLYGGLLLLLGLATLVPRPKPFMIAALACVLLFEVTDQTRWQPWVYQYALMLGALLLSPWRSDSADDFGRSLNPCRLILACIYFWSGLQKINASFMTLIAPWLLEPVLNLLPQSLGSLLPKSIPAIPFVEMSIGAGLLFRPTRVFAVAGGIGMHCFILYSIGPFGHRWNNVVWPWNFAMITLLCLLFVRTRDVVPRAIVWPSSIYGKIVLLLMGVMPAFSLLGWWDAYLSAALYSGNAPQAIAEVPDEIHARFPEIVREKCTWAPDGRHRIDFLNWSMADLNVPPNPAERIFKQVARRLSEQNGGAPVRLQIQKRPPANRASRAVEMHRYP